MKSLLASLLLVILFYSEANSQTFRPDFFCFEDAFLLSPDNSFESRVTLLKDLGFDGIELEGLDNADEKLKVLDKSGLKLFMVYIQVDLEKPEPYDPRLKEFIKKIDNRKATIWIHIHSDRLNPSDTAGDAKCISIIRDLAGYSARYGVNIALYPHSGFWLEKVGDSVRLTKKINCGNVGAVFNLCHFLKTDDRAAIERKLEEAIPYLAAVSINGATDGKTSEMDWSDLIKPLGSGNFDVINILRILKKDNFKGPVGLQCYNIKGEPSEFLKKSMMTWHDYLKLL